LGVNISQMTRHPSGLYYLDVVEGDGPLASTDIGVQITFQGWLHDGTAVDAGVYPGGPQSPGSVLGLDGEWYYLLGSG
ncbi:MAG: hypothetical protein GWN18_00815, partial [Thermoplasmata archaeon]|nr:hypothetical protein [Thermoplasmata archaeon]NIU47653.1 hypothetical protein [Thermoplasmata archaeon]NIW81132.1 hypothetical protein [Thermoplasmata archaeon]